MKTVTIQIGNSDDKLTQKEWSEFVKEVSATVMMLGRGIHFFGGSANWEEWQNAAWVFTCQEERIEGLKEVLAIHRKRFKQDAVALTVGETVFI